MSWRFWKYPGLLRQRLKTTLWFEIIVFGQYISKIAKNCFPLVIILINKKKTWVSSSDGPRRNKYPSKHKKVILNIRNRWKHEEGFENMWDRRTHKKGLHQPQRLQFCWPIFSLRVHPKDEKSFSTMYLILREFSIRIFVCNLKFPPISEPPNQPSYVYN